MGLARKKGGWLLGRPPGWGSGFTLHSGVRDQCSWGFLGSLRQTSIPGSWNDVEALQKRLAAVRDETGEVKGSKRTRFRNNMKGLYHQDWKKLERRGWESGPTDPITGLWPHLKFLKDEEQRLFFFFFLLRKAIQGLSGGGHLFQKLFSGAAGTLDNSAHRTDQVSAAFHVPQQLTQRV